jgi:O-antigen/teichoic acid export membrane protein
MEIKKLINLKILFENRTIKQTIFKNTFWLGAGEVISGLLKMFLLIYAARILGATDYGKFTFALSFVSLLVIFHDFGLPAVITREFAGNKEKEGEFYSVASFKILLSIISFILIFGSSFFITPDPAIRKIIWILSFFSITNGFASFFYAFFRARQKMEYQAWSEIVQALFVSVVGFFVLFSSPSSLNLSYAYLIAAFAALLVVAGIFHFKLVPLKIHYRKEIWKKFFNMSWPLAFITLFGILYTNIDSVMMGYFGMIKETGYYNAALRVTTVVLMPIALISGSFFPALSIFFRESREKLQKLWEGEVKIMIFLAVPVVIGGITLAPRLIYFLYSSDFGPSILTLKILMIMMGALFIYQPLYDVLIACNQQKKTFWITFFGALGNIILNFILIPRYSLYGAAAATVATYLILLAIAFYFVKTTTPIRLLAKGFFSAFCLSLISGGIMYLTIRQQPVFKLNVLISVPLGVIVYFASLFILMKITKSLAFQSI